MISPHAVIHPAAKIGENVTIGPFTVIGEQVEIGANTWIGPHVVINGPTTIGSHNKIYQFCSLGEEGQNIKTQLSSDVEEKVRNQLKIGDRNIFRENITISKGTHKGGGLTSIGDDNYCMAYVHIAHDCQIGHHNIFSNNATLGGHVMVENHVNLGGFVGIHQFCRVGSYSFCGGFSAIAKDVPPFVFAFGQLAQVHGLNLIGLQRAGFSDHVIVELKRAYKILYRQNLSLSESLEQLTLLIPECDEVRLLINFISESVRGIIR